MLALTAGCANAPLSGSGIGEGQWEGEIQGQVYDQSFRLPVTVELREPMPSEDNPLHVFVGAGDASHVGDLGLYSAWQFTTSSGRRVTLQYLSVEVQGSRLGATLTDEHGSEAAVINQFTAPNVTAQNAPPGPASQPFENLGPTELFGFDKGTELTMHSTGERLAGNIRGSGHSLTGVFSLPDVIYQARFVATRKR